MTADYRNNPPADLNDQDLLAFAKQAAHSSRLRLVQNRAVITAEEFATALGNISQRDLSEAVQAGRLFTVEFDGQLYYPAFYTTQDIDKTQLECVTQELTGLTGWLQWQFFTTPKASLSGLTPLQALQGHGAVAEVVRAAAGFAER